MTYFMCKDRGEVINEGGGIARANIAGVHFYLPVRITTAGETGRCQVRSVGMNEIDVAARSYAGEGQRKVLRIKSSDQLIYCGDVAGLGSNVF